MRDLKVLFVAGTALAACVTAAFAAEPAPGTSPAPAAAAPAPPLPYGPPVSLEQARRIVAAAEAEARRHGYLMAFAVVEPTGSLVYFERMDGTQYGSVQVSQEKATTAARFKRPSKAFSDGVMAGRANILSLNGVTAVEGGIPIVVDGHIIGAIGASGGSSDQDGAMAAAGLLALR